MYAVPEPLLLDAVKGRRLKLRDQHPHTLDSVDHLIDLYQAWGRPEEAKKWQTELSALSDQPSATQKD